MIITNMMLSDHDHYKLFSYMLTTIMTIGHDERTVAYPMNERNLHSHSSDRGQRYRNRVKGTYHHSCYGLVIIYR